MIHRAILGRSLQQFYELKTLILLSERPHASPTRISRLFG
jgi:hypothetical protein